MAGPILKAPGFIPNLQRTYVASGTGPHITLDGYRGGLEIRDAYVSIGGSLFAIQDNADTNFFNVGPDGIDVNNLRVLNVATPLSGTNAANRDYVDAHGPVLDGYALDSDLNILEDQVTDVQNSLDGYGSGGGITATEGADGYITFFTGPDAIAGDNDLFYNRATGSVSITGGGGLGIGISPVSGTRLTLPQENDAATPTLAFGDGDTGWYEESDGYLVASIEGTARFNFFSNVFRGFVNGAGMLMNEVSSATNPTLVPSSTNSGTGVGLAGSGQLSLIGNGTELMRLSSVAGEDTLITPIGGLIVTGGLSTSISHVVKAAASQSVNIAEWQDSTDTILMSVGPTGNLLMGATNGPRMSNLTASRTTPTFSPLGATNPASGIGGALGEVSLIGNAIEVFRISIGLGPIALVRGTLSIELPVNAQQLSIKTATTELTALSGATVTATNLIPAGSLVLGVSARVTTAVEGASDFDIGDGTDPDIFGAAIAIGINTTSDLTDSTVSTPTIYAAATSVVLTGNGSFTAGAVRITVHYITIVAPTS